MVVDSHTHYLEPQTAERPYAHRATMAPISHDEIVKLAAEAGVDRVVQVTASTMGHDNRYSLEGAAAHPERICGVIGRFDPIAPGVRDRLQEYAAQPNILGIRITLFHDPAAARWLEDRALDPFLHAMTGQPMALCVHAPGQTDQLLETVRRHPGVRFIVDHMNIRHEAGMEVTTAFRQWPKLLELASLENAWIKVSYFPEAAMESERYPYPTSQQRFRQLYESVGAARLLWGSNYPPVGRACTWREALEFVSMHCDFLPAGDRDAILGHNFLRDFMP